MVKTKQRIRKENRGRRTENREEKKKKGLGGFRKKPSAKDGPGT